MECQLDDTEYTNKKYTTNLHTNQVILTLMTTIKNIALMKKHSIFYSIKVLMIFILNPQKKYAFITVRVSMETIAVQTIPKYHLIFQAKQFVHQQIIKLLLRILSKHVLILKVINLISGMNCTVACQILKSLKKKLILLLNLTMDLNFL